MTAEPLESIDPAEDELPWCEECHRLIPEDEITEDGECATCGTVLFEPARRKVPGYITFLVICTVIYVIYRIVQLAMWISHHA